jgi:hypothetical protein
VVGSKWVFIIKCKANQAQEADGTIDKYGNLLELTHASKDQKKTDQPEDEAFSADSKKKGES